MQIFGNIPSLARALLTKHGYAFVGIFVFLIASLANCETVSLDDPVFCAALLESTRAGSVGVIEDPIVGLKEQFGPDINDPGIPRGLHEFEDSVIELFDLSPGLRDLATFQRRWSLSADQALDILIYYGTKIFYGDIRIAGDPEIVLDRLRTISFEYFLRSQHPTALRYEYYKKNLVLKSVPEMAHELNITEGQVYSDMLKLRLSRVEAFHNLSADIPVGEQSQRFIDHHLHIANRGIGWQRTLMFEGTEREEAELLVLLHERGMTASEIAQKLNETLSLQPSDAEIRTEASVHAKISQLGIAQENVRGSESIFDSQYGFLKRRGQLVLTTVHRFLFENSALPLAQLAQRLDISEGSLRDFINRNHLGENQAILVKYDAQKNAINLILRWIQINKRLPKKEDLGNGSGKIPLQYALIFPNHRGASAKPTRTSVFRSRTEAWLAINREGMARNIDVPLVDVTFHREDVTPELRMHWQNEMIELILKWMAEHAWRWPLTEDFEPKDAQRIQIEYNRVFGRSRYTPTGAFAEMAIFPNLTEGLMRIYREAMARGLPAKLIQAPFWGKDGISDEIRQIWQTEAIQDILNWCKENIGKQPGLNDFAAMPVLASVPIGRLIGRPTGNTAYTLNGSSQLWVFDSPARMWLRIKKEATLQGIPFRAINTYIADPFKLEEFAEECREEHRIETLNWILCNKRFPLKSDYGYGPNQIHINYAKLFGGRKREPGSAENYTVLYSSTSEGYQRIIASINTDERFSVELRQSMQKHMARFLIEENE